MPRNVRNFWVEMQVDGRKENIAAGPVAKDGGFELTVFMRDGGEVRRAIEMRGYEYDGSLHLWVRTADAERTGIFSSGTSAGFDIETQR